MSETMNQMLQSQTKSTMLW